MGSLGIFANISKRQAVLSHILVDKVVGGGTGDQEKEKQTL